MGWSPGPPPPIPGFVSAVPGGQRERGPSAVSPGPEQGWPEGFVLQGCVPPPRSFDSKEQAFPQGGVESTAAGVPGL